jgi:hypothetical protein
MMAPQQQAPQVEQAHQLLVQPGIGERADDRAADRLHAAQQHHQQRVHERGMAM